ncbi:MAG: response regulator [Vallitaleaceae bacterium]|nr:response regulator [Vallitaleaceae bacterium]
MYKLLIVDDEEIEREAIKFIVEGSRLEINEIKEAANGLEAVSYMTDFDPDLVLLDIKMPGLNGLEAGKIMKKMKPSIKIVFLTAYDSFDYAREAIKIGVEEFIVKPAPIDKTIETLDHCILKLDQERKTIQNKEKLEIKLDQVSRYLESEFVGSVVNGEIDEKQAEDYLKFMLSDFKEGFGLVVEMDFIHDQETTNLHQSMIRKRFADHLTTSAQGNMRLLINQLKNTFYIFVFSYRCENKQNCIRILEDEIELLREEMNDQMPIQLYYGFGDSYSSISKMWKSFAQARAMAKNMLMDRTENCEDNCAIRKRLEFCENELCDSIFEDREEDMLRITDYVLDQVIFASKDSNLIRLKLYEFVSHFYRYLNKEGQIKYEVPESVFEEIKGVDSKGEARRYLHRYLLEILKEVQEQRDTKTPAVLDKAIRYIHTHYVDAISLEEVAAESGFSTFYFGKMFKKMTKQNFTDYLTDYRISQAKILLKNPQLTIKDVTYSSGFMDPNYFTRVFKKVEGITPTEYRNR